MRSCNARFCRESARRSYRSKLVNSVTEAASRPISMICNLASSILRSVSKLSASRVAGSKHTGDPRSPQIAFASALTSAVATTCCAARPCRSALRQDFAFPELVRGPLLLAPLRRLALILSCELTFMISLWVPTVLHLPSLVDCAIGFLLAASMLISGTAHSATDSIGWGRVDARSRDRPLHLGRWFTLSGD